MDRLALAWRAVFDGHDHAVKRASGFGPRGHLETRFALCAAVDRRHLDGAAGRADALLFGSANWDARSLRLNFEFEVECYSADLGERLEALVGSKRATARRVTWEGMDGRPLPMKLRDGIARLFAPYL